MKRAESVEQYIADADNWQDELGKLRGILRSTKLEEGVKWGAPCYMHDGKNVVGIGAFKSYFGLLFYQGALLSDKKGVLINAQEGKTKALRQWRMNRTSDIKPSVIRSYVKEAVGLATEGRAIGANRAKPVVVPAELKKAFRANKKAAANFKGMRLGLRREYADYIADAKRDETKQRRIDKILPMISAGVGLNDQYR
jgi:uncharacterized protein YdeI (YjbR/CyaY-like superfamily)